jgi:hypothetical protein
LMLSPSPCSITIKRREFFSAAGINSLCSMKLFFHRRR